MLTSLAFVFLLGLAMAAICQKIHLPRIIGMLFTGILLGPYVLNALDSSILLISADLRKMALIIILIKAGLSLNISDLRKVGRPAIMMSFLPAGCEMAAYTLLAPYFLGVTRLEAAILGAVLGAVSPAVVIPKMVQLMENHYGTDKSIPQLILAGASLDDVFCIVMFTTFISMEQGNSASVMNFMNIPISIALGIFIGGLTGWLMAMFFETAYRKNSMIRNSTKVIVMLGAGFFLMAIESWLSDIIAVSGLLAVMSMACMVQVKSTKEVTSRLSEKFGKIWIAAEVILFVLVGAAVDIRYTMEAGFSAVVMILLVLLIRSLGVSCCMLGTPLNRKERLFCVIAYLPKATVQAAMGSVPMALGLPCGKIVLSIAVLAILITAPMGALGMEATYQRLLRHESIEKNIADCV